MKTKKLEHKNTPWLWPDFPLYVLTECLTEEVEIPTNKGTNADDESCEAEREMAKSASLEANYADEISSLFFLFFF